jgi:phosphatidylglycerophosphate synthase
MLDRVAAAAIRPGVQLLARGLARTGVSPNAVTYAAFVVGLVAALAIAWQFYLAGALLILLSRLLDALDGAVARLANKATDQGGFLDIALDFLFYASIPLAFAWANPAHNALAAATLLAAFIGTGSSFLAFAVMAAKRGMSSMAYPDKSFYFLGGLTEATETLAFFVAMCLWPTRFSVLAYIFAALCAVTIFTRISWGLRVFR